MDFPIEIQSEFQYIVRAFQFVASMFSATSGYTGFLATLGALGIFFGGMSAISAQAMGSKSGIQAWFVNMLAASAVIVILLGSKSTVIIHDTVSNQMRAVGGVPTVMAALAYMENRVENGVKDIISLVMSPIIPYDDIGKGEGFELLASMDKAVNAYITRYPNIMRSMEGYFEDCGLKDLARGWISEDAIYRSEDMWADLRSDTQTNFTVVYDRAQGTTYSCKNAWDKINDMLTVAQVRSAVESQCREKYSNPDAVNKCMQNQEDIVAGLFRGTAYTSIDLNSIIRSYLVSYAMHSSNGTLGVMLNEVNKKNASNAFMAEKMLPRLKGMMYGMMIGVFPLLVGFVWFNPAKTIIFYAGMFIMLILWSAIDTFMDMQYQNEVYQMFATMRDRGLGVSQMFDIPNKAADAVALYGSGRWMAMGLATAISAAITGINSYAISQMGSQLGASAQSAAASAAGYMDSAGRTALDRQAAGDFGSRALSSMMSVPNWNAIGAGNAMDAKAASAKTSMLTQDSSMEAVANGMGAAAAVGTQKNMSAAQAQRDYFGNDLSKIGALAANQSIYDAAKQENFLNQQSSDESLVDAGRAAGATAGINQDKDNIFAPYGLKETLGKTEGWEREIKATGMTWEQLNTFHSNGVLDGNMAKILNEKTGGGAFKSGMAVAYGVDDKGEMKNIRTSWQSQGEELDGLTVPQGADVTQNIGSDGKILQTSVNGGGYEGYTKSVDGNEYGKHTYEKDGLTYTEIFNGSHKTISYNKNGADVQESFAKVDGEWIATSKNVGNDYSISNEAMERIKQGDLSMMEKDLFDADGNVTAKGQAAMGQIAAALKQFYQNNVGNQNNINLEAYAGVGFSYGVKAGVEAHAGLGASESEQYDKLEASLRNLYNDLGNNGEMSVDEKVDALGNAISDLNAKGLDGGKEGVTGQLGNKIQEGVSEMKETVGGIIDDIRGKK